MSTTSKERDEVRKLILSLLLSKPEPIPITVLDRDYYEMEGKRIPWYKFGYVDLVSFLNSMPEYFSVEWRNGGHIVSGIASEKSKHVSSLVSRQKIAPKRYNLPHRRPFVHRQMPPMPRQRIRIPADHLGSIVKYVRNSPQGVPVQTVIAMVQQQMPHSSFNIFDVRDQLRELPHFLYLDGDKIYPTNVTNDASRQVNNHSQSLMSQPQNVPRPSEFVGGDEGSDLMGDFSDEDFNNSPTGYEDSNYSRQPKTSERIAANFTWNANNEQNATTYNYNDKYFAATNKGGNADVTAKADYIDVASLISDRTKSRLDQLVRQHTKGIWCAELPEKYLEAYNVHLNYIELGFTSVREYVSYLPNIFYMTRSNSTDDFMLYSADKRPTVPDQEEPFEIRPNSREQHDKHNTVRTQLSDNDAPIPADVSSSITKTFAPDGVMNYNDSVEQILVTDLQRDRKYLEVYIVEIFHPIFFWIHLRENKKRFDVFMDELDKFYHNNKDKYLIPKIALKKGLNCACIYSGRWHRGIIRSVKPDFRVTVMFYDYGTLKTYAAEELYYLYKQFSHLPAQAIPCGLYNVKPCVGDRWKKSVIDKLIDRIDQTLLALTIMSVDPANNSMMVILSDTSEEEDVHINDWLIKEKLARCGKMVRMCEHLPYLHYLACNNITTQSSTSVPIAYLELSDIVSDRVIVNEARHDRDQSVPCSNGAHKLCNDAKSENIESKTIEVSHNIPFNKKVLLEMLRNVNSANAKSSDVKLSDAKSSDAKSSDAKSSDAKSSDAKSSDTRSQSTDCLRNEKPRGLKKLARLLETLKTSNITPNSNSSISASKPNHDFKDNAQQSDSDIKIIQSNVDHTLDMEFRDSDKKNNGNVKNGGLNMNFAFRDPDNEENKEKDFGTFRSLYGGRGLMEPFDWSVIKENGHSLSKTIVTSRNNLNITEEYKNNITENKSGSHKINNRENESSPANPYFLNMTRKENEYYLPEKNIDYDFKNVSQSVARLRNRMEVHNDKYTTVIMTKNILEKLCNNTYFQNTSSPDTNSIKTNGVASSKVSAQTEMVNGNGEVCETRIEQKIEENRDLGANTNNKNTIECNTDSSPESKTTGKAYNPRYKALLDQMKRVQVNSINSNISSSIYSAKDSSSSEQILSSCSSSTLSSNDEQYEDFRNQSNELCNFKKLASTSSSNISLDRDFKETKHLLSSENNSDASFNMNDSKQDQLAKSNPIVSDDDDFKRSNATVEKVPRTSKMLQLVLKKTSANASSKSELDSDDLSNRETVGSDTSYDKIESNSIDNLMIENYVRCNSTNNDINEDTFDPPVLDDCDLESDESVWDYYVPFLEIQPVEQIEISDDDSMTLKI